jgi:BlaI family transcriptional regulator, penicillinase repressor
VRERVLRLNEQELEAMKILWDRGEVSVRTVYEELSLHWPIPYTAVMTMLGVLEGKQYVQIVSAEESGLVYRAVRQRNDVLGEMASEFVARVFDGSGRELVESLLRTGAVRRDELHELSRLPVSEGEAVR